MRGQTSGEFIVVLSSLMIIFLIFYTTYLGNTGLLYQEQDRLMTSRNAYALATAINYVHLAGDGASYAYSLGGVTEDENITISEVAVESARPYSVSDAPLLNSDVNTTVVEPGEMTIRNVKGEIRIEQ